MKRSPHTPRWTRWPRVVSLLLAVGAPLRAQTIGTTPLLDALSITVQSDSTTVARGSMRYRQVRTGADLDLVASGIVVRRGLRVTAELHTDSVFGLRKYVAESRDSAGKLLDRVQVTSAGGRVTLERVTSSRRMVREFAAHRDIVILDSAAVVPFVALAALGQRNGTLGFLDVRRGTLTAAQVAPGLPGELSVAEVIVTGTPITVSGLGTPLSWWRDAKGRLLRVLWGPRGRVLRDDPPP